MKRAIAGVGIALVACVFIHAVNGLLGDIEGYLTVLFVVLLAFYLATRNR